MPHQALIFLVGSEVDSLRREHAVPPKLRYFSTFITRRYICKYTIFSYSLVVKMVWRYSDRFSNQILIHSNTNALEINAFL